MNRSWRTFLVFCSEAAGWVGGLLILLAVAAWRELAEELDNGEGPQP
jgi:hypothetical protein